MSDALTLVETSYRELWESIAGGALLRSFGVFLLLAFTCYFVYCRSRRSWRHAWRYVFPKQLYAHDTSRVDRWHWALMTILWTPMAKASAAILGLIVGFSLRDQLVAHFGARAVLLQTPWIVVLVYVTALFVVRHWVIYVVHVAQHKVPLLWSFHRAHHSAETLTFFTGARLHPVETFYGAVLDISYIGLVSGAIQYLTATTMGAVAASTWLTVETILGLGSVLAHTHIPLSFGRFNCVLGSAVLHQIHHSAELRHRDRNFGTTLMVFDWMFGTLYSPSADETYRWGLNDAEMGRNNPHNRVRDFYLEPVEHFWKELEASFHRSKDTIPLSTRSRGDG
jgi:sterol desaturase/sphingolipid hydroxylase (fatty acid hydroxylase superfamily)